MRRYFMTTRSNLTHKMGETLRNPAENEERCLRLFTASVVRFASSVAGVEEVEEAVGILFNTQFIG
jgi:hypothetical protein